MTFTTETVGSRTEADAVAELAAGPEFLPVDAGDTGRMLLPPGWTSSRIDASFRLPAPTRSHGTISVYDADSFVAAVEARRVADPVVYADEDRLALVAVLNDDTGPEPGWRDYRVELALRPTPEWNHWTGQDGRLMGQEAFAEHVENGLSELRSPAPAAMLDLAQTLHANVNTRVRSGRRLADGRVQLAYEEEVEASAGADGTVVIPDTIELAVKPFVGLPAYELLARFRYRLPRGGGEVTMGYKLNRPHEVKRAAYLDVRSEVATALADALLIAGPAPDTAVATLGGD
jgi:uncharacterized protein YfdQ (DUF2303 family)